MKWFTIIKMNSSYNVFIDNVQTEVMKVADAFADTLSEYLKRIDCWDPEDFEFIYNLPDGKLFNMHWRIQPYYSFDALAYDFWLVGNSNESTTNISFNIILDLVKEQFNIHIQNLDPKFPNFGITVKLKPKSKQE